MEENAQLYLFYDGECQLCVRFKEWIEGRDPEGRIRALELGEPGLEERFAQVEFARAREQLTVCDQKGEVYEGLAALGQLARHLPGLRRLEWIYRLPGVQTLARGVYRTANRYRRSLCLRCGEKWMPSKKYSQRQKRAGRRGR